MGLSLVIPTYTLNTELEQMALKAVESYRPHVDEIVVSEDGGLKSDALAQAADTYVYQAHKGFTANVNTGWREAHEEYVAIANSDTRHYKGKLTALCLPGRVTSPAIAPISNPNGRNPITELWGAFFVVPRDVRRERGMLDERMSLFMSDIEYGLRVFDLYTYVASVQIEHLCNKTLVDAWPDEDARRAQWRQDDAICWKVVAENQRKGR